MLQGGLHGLPRDANTARALCLFKGPGVRTHVSHCTIFRLNDSQKIMTI